MPKMSTSATLAFNCRKVYRLLMCIGTGCGIVRSRDQVSLTLTA